MRPRAKSAGFVLAELIVVLVVATIVITGLLAGLLALIRGLQPPSVAYGGETLAVAPAFAPFPAALALHDTFIKHLGEARAVYVFGGRHLTLPVNSPESAVLPLKLESLPNLQGAAAGLPSSAKAFYDSYESALGPSDASRSPDDFTVLMVGIKGDVLDATCLVQVRRRDIAVSDGTDVTSYVFREVKLWDEAPAPVRYAFLEKPAVASGIFVGAVHTWMRYLPEGVGEEGPVCAVFPDPWLFGGGRGTSTDIPVFSRFSYWCAVSR